MDAERTPEIWSERWQLAALSKDEMIRIGLLSAIVGLVYVLFHFQGNTSDVNAFGRSALLWMISRWKDAGLSFGGLDHSHGALIPFVSVALLWMKREELLKAPKSVSRIGLTVLVSALLLHWLGAKAQQVRLSLFALIGLIWGVPFYLYGWRVAKLIIFPVSYLIFCVPLNFLDRLSFPLRIATTNMTTFLLNGIGIAVEKSGTAILAKSGEFSLEVADPCSGLRSLVALTALAAIYAYMTQPTLFKKWVLFLCAIPLAVVGNMARITTIALVSQAFGQEFGTRLYHDFSGYVIFMLFTIPLLMCIGVLMNTDYRKVWAKWKQGLLNPT